MIKVSINILWGDFCRMSSLRKREEAAQKRRTELVKRYTDERVAAIKAEQAAEEAKIQAVIDGINEEIAARRRLREEEADEDTVAKAKKTWEAAQAQLAFEHDEQQRAELEKEVKRAREAYEKAVQDKADNDWYYAKQQEIAGLEAQKSGIKEKYQGMIDSAGAWAEGRAPNGAAGNPSGLSDAEIEAIIKTNNAVSAAAGGAIAGATAAAAQVVKNVMTSIDQSKTVNQVTVNAGAPATSGSIDRAVAKALARLERM